MKAIKVSFLLLNSKQNAKGLAPVYIRNKLSGNKVTLLLFVLMPGLFNGFVKELGWTGFVTHKLRVKRNLIAAGLIVGVMRGFMALAFKLFR